MGVENCFTWTVSTAQWSNLDDPTITDLWGSPSAWIWSVRDPSADFPLIVDVGPGVFGPFRCKFEEVQTEPFGRYRGWVTLRGSGREQTILDEAGSSQSTAIRVEFCRELSFISLGARGNYAAVYWLGGGTGSWSDVDLVGMEGGASHVGAGWGWYDNGCSDDFPNVQYFHNSRVRRVGMGRGNFQYAWYGNCAETWFFAGELLIDVPRFENESTTAQEAAVASVIYLTDRADFRAFGTSVRLDVRDYPDPYSGGIRLRLVELVADSVFHAHGSAFIASVNVEPPAASPPLNVEGLVAVLGSPFVHTPGSSWVFDVSPGTAARIMTNGSGVIQSPFLWASGPGVPGTPAATFSSFTKTGQDLFVETDCDASGCSGGSFPHLMIYSETCAQSATGSPWFDTVRKKCRD